MNYDLNFIIKPKNKKLKDWNTECDFEFNNLIQNETYD